MSWFNNRSIRTKLLGSFIAVVALLGVATGFAILAIQQAVDNMGELHDTHVLGLVTLDEAKQELLLSNVTTMDALLADSPSEAAAIVTEAAAHVTATKRLLTEYRGSQADPAILAGVDAALESTGSLEAMRATIFDRIVEGDVAGAIEMNENGTNGALSGDEMAQSVVKSLNETTLLAQGAADTLYADAKDAGDRAIAQAALFAVIAGAAGIGLGYYMARTIRNSVGQVVNRIESIEKNCLTDLQGSMQSFARGDLTVAVKPVTPKIPKYHNDEVGRASAVVNTMLDRLVAIFGDYGSAQANLSKIIGQVRDGSEHLRVSAGQLKESSDQMASATGQIAMAINEVTRSAVSLSELSQDSAREIELVATGSKQVANAADTNANAADQSRSEASDMSARIEQVSAASRLVAESAEQSREAAREGHEAVTQAVSSMESIAAAVERASQTVGQLGEYGQQIGDIVKVIDEIAAQTNLLALNAAIEAARAGEQGRGFAVVAENVRHLAERSGESTKEIAALIARVQTATQEAVQVMETGVNNVHEGREITGQAGRSLETIIATVSESAVQMERIARDVQGLSAGAGRIVSSAETIAAKASESATGAGEMASSTSRVTEAILQVSATSEQTSASAEEVSASTEELSAQSEELAATASEVRNVAEELAAAAARFKLA